ncbi:hypothetical protein LPJ73_006290, partial [Coemansia sp. RSA 2703]
MGCMLCYLLITAQPEAPIEITQKVITAAPTELASDGTVWYSTASSTKLMTMSMLRIMTTGPALASCRPQFIRYCATNAITPTPPTIIHASTDLSGQRHASPTTPSDTAALPAAPTMPKYTTCTIGCTERPASRMLTYATATDSAPSSAASDHTQAPTPSSSTSGEL